MSKLIHNHYGKHRVRVLKVLRAEESHAVCEIEADVLLQGELEESYLTDENRTIVPTDTVKNTVHVLANESLAAEKRTAFASVIGEHFLAKYAHLHGVTVELRERRWRRMSVHGAQHQHAFEAEANGTWYSRGSFQRDTPAVLSSGLRDHLVMKTTGSAFIGYHVCELTTLPPADDRILATRLSAEWFYATPPEDEAAVEKSVIETIHRIFAETHSPSVQRTLYQTGDAILAAVPGIDRVELKMPNIHFPPLDLSQLGQPDQDSVFQPTDEPHGEIDAVVSR